MCSDVRFLSGEGDVLHLMRSYRYTARYRYSSAAQQSRGWLARGRGSHRGEWREHLPPTLHPSPVRTPLIPLPLGSSARAPPFRPLSLRMAPHCAVLPAGVYESLAFVAHRST